MNTQSGFVNFSTSLINILNNGFMGVSLARIVLALALFLTAFLLREKIAGLFFRTLRRWLVRNKTGHGHIQEIIDAVEEPVKFTPVVFGVIIAVECLHPTGRVAALTDKMAGTLVTFTLFWVLVSIVRPLSFIVTRFEKLLSPAMVNWIVRGIRLGLVLFGAITILDSWGIKVGPIVAGVGIFGVAVALGAQDMFKNLIGGLVVLAERRYQIGDWVNIKDVAEGVIAEIGFRSTTILRADKSPVYVPNGKLADAIVTNFSANPLRRIYWTVSVSNKTTTEQLRQICEQLQKYLNQSPDFVKPPEASAFVRVESFTDTAINLMLYCFTRTSERDRWQNVNDSLSDKVNEIVKNAGASFASDVPYVEGGPNDFPEQAQPKESDFQVAQGFGKNGTKRDSKGGNGRKQHRLEPE